MAWFAELAGKAENLLNTLDEQTGAALSNATKGTLDKCDYTIAQQSSGPKKRVIPRKNNAPDKRSPPSGRYSLIPNSRSPSKDIQDNKTIKAKKKPHVGNQRRCSLPVDLEVINENERFLYQMQNLEVENAMLRNEINFANREMSELVKKLRSTEDVVEELKKSQFKFETSDLMCHKLNMEESALLAQVEQQKKKLLENVNTETAQHDSLNKRLQDEIDSIKTKMEQSDQKCNKLSNELSKKIISQIKLKNDLRHTQSTITYLQNDLEKSNDECRRLEKDWAAYKLRVKKMLLSKDNTIKSLQEGIQVNVDTKELMQEIDNLKSERDELSEVTGTIRNQCNDMKLRLDEVEARHNTSERIVCALRDALREERAARNRADAQYASVAKDLKAIQIETGHTIANLRTTIRDKDDEINRLRATSSVVRSTDTSAINVADYDSKQNTINHDKIKYLTHTLVQRQSKISKLLAENNILKIQLEKSESKYKTDISAVRTNSSHSVVHLQDGDCRHRSRTYMPTDTLSALSVRIGVMVKRYPILGVMVMAYMVCLHFWVLTVLCTSTPENMNSRPAKSW